MGDTANARTTAARAFVRSLNILLKFARMYDFGHPRTTAQYETAWSELRMALGSEEGEASLLLAVSSDQLLVDGTPLEVSAAEKSFVRMLSSAGIASLHFSPKVTRASVAGFVRAFPTGANVRPGQIAEQLKAALQDDPYIQVNEVCFVPADSAVVKSTVAAQLAAQTMGLSSQSDELFRNPEKLLQLMVAAEGTKRASHNTGGGGAPDGAASGSQNPAGPEDESSTNYYLSENPDLIVKNESAFEWTAPGDGRSAGARVDEGASSDFASWNNRKGSGEETVSGSAAGALAGQNVGRGSVTLQAGSIQLKESELQGILHVLAQIGRKGESSKEKLDASTFQSQLAALPQDSPFTVNQVLATLAAQAPAEAQDGPGLLKLAEHIAVRFALESYERGDTKVNAVQQTLSDMNQELDGLRKVLGVYEEKMTEAGIGIQSQNEVLAQRFWTQVPEEKKKSVLESNEAWCVPAGKVREHVEALRASGQTDAAEKILKNYGNALTNKATEPRRQTAMGLAELAPVYANSSRELFLDTIRMAGIRLAEESDEGLRSLASAAFVRLAQEAANKRVYPAVQRAVEMVDYLEAENPNAAKNLRPRIRIENRLLEFIDEALKNGHTPNGLTELLRRMPRAASEQIAVRFGRAVLVEDSESLLWMMETLGQEAIEHLRTRFEQGEPSEAIETVGLLTRIDYQTIERLLPERVKEWKRVAHDRVVRQIATSGAPQRGLLLLNLFDMVDPLVRPAVIDEIGISGELSAEMTLLRMAEGHLPENGTEYLRVKAIEALGRLGTTGAEAVLRKIAEARKTFRWAYPYELRLAATQAMKKINGDWVQTFIPRSELSVAELMIEPLSADPAALTTAQRRYERFRMDPPVPGATTNLKKNCRVDVREMSLSGGMAIPEHTLHPGSVLELRLNPNGKSIRVRAVIRSATPQALTFEIVDIDLEERSKLRKLLAQAGSASKAGARTAEDQNSRSQQTVSSVSS